MGEKDPYNPTPYKNLSRLGWVGICLAIGLFDVYSLQNQQPTPSPIPEPTSTATPKPTETPTPAVHLIFPGGPSYTPTPTEANIYANQSEVVMVNRSSSSAVVESKKIPKLEFPGVKIDRNEENTVEIAFDVGPSASGNYEGDFSLNLGKVNEAGSERLKILNSNGVVSAEFYDFEERNQIGSYILLKSSLLKDAAGNYKIIVNPQSVYVKYQDKKGVTNDEYFNRTPSNSGDMWIIGYEAQQNTKITVSSTVLKKDTTNIIVKSNPSSLAPTSAPPLPTTTPKF